MEEDIIKNQLKEAKEEYKRKIEFLTKKEANELLRREAVFGYYEVMSGKKMTEEQYLRYIEIFKKAKAGYNIRNFVDSETKKENETHI